MRVVVDTHGHVDDRHDVAVALRHALRNLGTLAGPAQADCAVVLTERGPQGLFQALGRRAIEARGLTIRPTDEAASLRVESADGGSLALIAGRQIVTAERLEVLALAPAGRLPGDGIDVESAVRAVVDSGGAPVLPWSPGKWLGTRGRLVASVLAQAKHVALADSALRPQAFPVPRLLAEGRAGGRAVVAGSDPLPLSGEERRLGAYATLWAEGWDPSRPATSLLRLIRERPKDAQWVGRRCTATGVALRLIRLARQRTR